MNTHDAVRLSYIEVETIAASKRLISIERGLHDIATGQIADDLVDKVVSDIKRDTREAIEHLDRALKMEQLMAVLDRNRKEPV